MLVHRRDERGMALLPFASRCVQAGEVHEPVATDHTGTAAGARIDRWRSSVRGDRLRGGLDRGDEMRVNGRVVGTVLGFDGCHLPNHYNIPVHSPGPADGRGARPRTPGPGGVRTGARGGPRPRHWIEPVGPRNRRRPRRREAGDAVSGGDEGSACGCTAARRQAATCATRTQPRCRNVCGRGSRTVPRAFSPGGPNREFAAGRARGDPGHARRRVPIRPHPPLLRADRHGRVCYRPRRGTSERPRW
ncbi:DUF6917 domain-containing protein [Streptomonospora algeriensis]